MTSKTHFFARVWYYLRKAFFGIREFWKASPDIRPKQADIIEPTNEQPKPAEISPHRRTVSKIRIKHISKPQPLPRGALRRSTGDAPLAIAGISRPRSCPICLTVGKISKERSQNWRCDACGYTWKDHQEF